jgi:hypothetical protein
MVAQCVSMALDRLSLLVLLDNCTPLHHTGQLRSFSSCPPICPLLVLPTTPLRVFLHQRMSLDKILTYYQFSLHVLLKYCTPAPLALAIPLLVLLSPFPFSLLVTPSRPALDIPLLVFVSPFVTIALVTNVPPCRLAHRGSPLLVLLTNGLPSRLCLTTSTPSRLAHSLAPFSVCSPISPLLVLLSPSTPIYLCLTSTPSRPTH